jgi:hypothetical protein
MRTIAQIVLTGLVCGSASIALAAAPRYHASFDATTQSMQVRVCLDAAHASAHFAADSHWAMRFVSELHRVKGAIDAGRTGWIAPDWRAGECLSYRADLGAIAAEHRPDVGYRLGADLLTAPQLWLLRPDAWSEGDASMRLTLPAGWSISAPWQRVSRDGDSVAFRIPHTPANWSASVAIGHFTEEPIALAGGQLRLSILDGASAAQRTKLHTWLAHVSHAIVSAYGRLPLRDVQVLMIPVGPRSRAVVFGASTRGEGNALELLIDPSRPLADFRDDWIAVHELSHLMHPFLGDDGAWLAEGLATYYQNVLRARAGLLTPAQAWDRLREGFAGNIGRQYEQTLAQAASDMSRRHDYQRVYWSGAAYWLAVDVELRSTSGGKRSVDLALSRFRDCCLPDHRGWQPADFVAKLDALLGTHVFARRYAEFAALRQFPDWQKTFAQLGIHDDNGKLVFDATPAAKQRDAIMRDVRSR